MKLTIIGTGYVGLVTGACLARVGNHVMCVDIDKSKIDDLSNGIIPIYEPGLKEIVVDNLKSNRLRFGTDLKAGVEFGDLLFIAVGTPESNDGSANLSYVLDVAKQIGTYLEDYKVIVNKSTAPIGSISKIRETIAETVSSRSKELDFDVISNPEFLKEGNAVEDFMKPDRIVVGSSSQKATKLIKQLYAPFNRNHDVIIVMDESSSELTKYAANVMLATKISLMNELANIAETTGADIDKVRLGIGADPRIGYKFIYPGCGYGGSCFPKDVRALSHTAKEFGLKADLIGAVEKVNESQKASLFKKLSVEFNNDFKDKTVSLWGLSFKPRTDDMREAPSIILINSVLEHGGQINAHDPIAIPTATKLYKNISGIKFFEDQYETLQGADALVICTEWESFRSPDFDVILKSLNKPIVVDGRNLYSLETMKEFGFNYSSIGRPKVTSF
jgi:UDPglucose 6-dehydrogenase